MEFVRIVPAQRFLGLPAPAHRPYAFYADADSLHGRTVAECYRLVKGLNLPAKGHYFQKERRSPYIWDLAEGDADAPLAKLTASSDGSIRFDDYPLEWLESTKFVVLSVSEPEAREHLDVFPATWRALSYIVSDKGRMGARPLEWDVNLTEFASARIHALFREAQEATGGNLLAEHQSKEELGLTNFWRLPEQEDELTFYQYLSVDSAFTNAIVELFGISHRCWHGCGYLGWPGFPLCRFFLLRNQMTSSMKVSILSGKERYLYAPKT